uniref:Uncharacterized protein n=1 Tax=Euplotes harpa TaxID=151035 RepID=A0A7S3NF36_9SPIT|mmetsp:Transcript_39400/g.45235  ORF Transcript_39400/g.45235 Transcript_39400/m.45235 type:complete len:165 (+) Transcript_39400:227-721(+)
MKMNKCLENIKFGSVSIIMDIDDNEYEVRRAKKALLKLSCKVSNCMSVFSVRFDENLFKQFVASCSHIKEIRFTNCSFDFYGDIHFKDSLWYFQTKRLVFVDCDVGSSEGLESTFCVFEAIMKGLSEEPNVAKSLQEISVSKDAISQAAIKSIFGSCNFGHIHI